MNDCAKMHTVDKHIHEIYTDHTSYGNFVKGRCEDHQSMVAIIRVQELCMVVTTKVSSH